jgi:uncharacterized C2H2 Zn-finger protein
VKCNLKRHQNAKHSKEIYEKQQNSINGQNVCPNGQNVCPNEQNVCPNEQNVCPKCKKIYKTKKHLTKHEKICKGIDELTCSRCMTSFTTRAAKHKHIKLNKCNARSIVHARTQTIQNTTYNNIQNIQNQNITNNIDNSITNNLIINNFGSERIDHISEEDIKQILQSGTNTVPLYIKKKHFDKNFPENQNIKYSNDNKCHVMEDNLWKEKDIALLSTDLIQDNTEVLLMYCDNNEIQLLKDIKDADKYEHIRNKLFIVYNKSDNQKYNAVLVKIRELIKNSV